MTNGLAESSDLIPVAVTRTPAPAAPVSGRVIGDPGGSTLSARVLATAPAMSAPRPEPALILEVEERAMSSLPQQAPFGFLAAPKRQPAQQNGQKAQETRPLEMPTRSFSPRPGH